MASEVLADARTGKNGRHALAGLFRQSVFGRLAGYEDVNEPIGFAMIRRCAGSSAARPLSGGASPSQMGRFETRWLAAEKNLSALAIFRVDGSTACTAADCREASCSTWI